MFKDKEHLADRQTKDAVGLKVADTLFVTVSPITVPIVFGLWSKDWLVYVFQYLRRWISKKQ